MIEFKYIAPFLTLLFGVFIGNRLALGRDKRKEYNEIVAPIRLKLIEQRDQLNDRDRGQKIDESLFNNLEASLGLKQFKHFLEAYEAYKLHYELAGEYVVPTFDNNGYFKWNENGKSNLCSSFNNLIANLPVK